MRTGRPAKPFWSNVKITGLNKEKYQTPEWRAKRAAKARAYRARKKAEAKCLKD